MKTYTLVINLFYNVLPTSNIIFQDGGQKRFSYYVKRFRSLAVYSKACPLACRLCDKEQVSLLNYVYLDK